MAARYVAVGLLAILAVSLLSGSRLAACPVIAKSTADPTVIGDAPHFVWPVHGTLIVDLCTDGSGRRLKGIDIAAAEGTPVRAAADGLVIYAGGAVKKFSGLVIIHHHDQWITAYAFNRRVLVRRGDRVRRGQEIALSGRTPSGGFAEARFEVRRGGNTVDPLRVLPRKNLTP